MRRRDLIVVAIGALTATLITVGFAYAVVGIPGADGVIQGCYDSGGNLKVVAALPCPKGYTSLPWNQKGDPGAPGSNGAPGEPGAAGVSPTVTQLASGDANCPAGGAAITDAGGSTAYVCSGQDGQDGQPFSGTFTSANGQYSINVSDTGITIAHGTDAKITLTGANIELLSADSTVIKAANNATIDAGTTASIKASNATIDSATNVSIKAAALATIDAGLATIKTGGQLNVDAGQNLIVNATGIAAISASGNFAIQGGGTGLVKSLGVLTLQGSSINEN